MPPAEPQPLGPYNAVVASDAMRAQPDRDYQPENRRGSLLTPTREVWDPCRIARR